MTSVLYRDLADELRAIVGGLDPGDRLPSEADLVREHKVSRQTVRSALTQLANEGLVISGQGRGWHKRDPRILRWEASEPESHTSADLSPADAWSEGIRAQGRIPAERITVETVLATGRVGELMELDPAEAVVVRRRLRYVDNVLHTTADTYFVRAMVAGTAIELPTDVLPGALTVLAEAGHPVRSQRDTIRVRPPTAAEAELFGLGPGVAVAEHVRVRRTGTGHVAAATVAVLPGDRNEIIYEGAVTA